MLRSNRPQSSRSRARLRPSASLSMRHWLGPQPRRLLFEQLENRTLLSINVAVIGGTANDGGFAARLDQLDDKT